MLGVAGILRKELTGKLFACSAVRKVFRNAALGDRAFSVEGIALCRYAAAAIASFTKIAGLADKTATGADLHAYPSCKFQEAVFSCPNSLSPNE